MSKIPDPETLVKIARSASHYVDDPEWKKYQRYLAKYAQNRHSPDQEPLNFEDFCATLRKKENNPQST